MDTNNRIFAILISLIWGFGLALLFKKTCQNDTCVIVRAPDNFPGRIKSGNKCYELTKYNADCIY